MTRFTPSTRNRRSGWVAPPLPYAEFYAWLRDCPEQDLSALLLPRPEARTGMARPNGAKFDAGRVCSGQCLLEAIHYWSSP
jgi:hypothetical protein